MNLAQVAQAQQIPHQPFPIADSTDGLNLAKQPWLSTKNSFRVLENGRVFRGQLIKRTGYTRFAETADEAADLSTPGNFAANGTIFYLHAGTFNQVRVIPESCSFTYDNGAGPDIFAEIQPYTEYWNGAPDADPFTGAQNVWSYDIFELSTTNVIGSFSQASDPTVSIPSVQSIATIDWRLHSGYVSPPDQDASVMEYRTNPENEVIGLARLRVQVGDFALAMDPGRVYSYDSATKFYQPQGKAASYAPYFTGGDGDYFWTWPLDLYLVFTNGVDPVHRWDPSAAADSSVIEMETDWDGGGNELDTARLAIRFRGRLVYLNTIESATEFKTRARFTAAGTFDAWDGPLQSFTDAPTELGEIVTAQFIGERLFVGFEDGWMELSYTGDSVKPFEWLPFISRFGAVSKLSTIRDNERLLSRAKTTLQAIDPNGQYYLDQEIPDLIQSLGPTGRELCSGFRNEAQRAFYWTAVNTGADKPTTIINATYDEESNLAWSTFDNMRFNVFSLFNSEQSPTWNSLGPATWNDLSTVTWNSARAGAEGVTLTIAGSDRGCVYEFDLTSRDGGASTGSVPINMSAETQRLAPFPGQRAHMGWIDVYAEAADGAEIEISFYVDSESAAYKTVTIDLSPVGGGSKVWRRVSVNQSGAFHRFRVRGNAERKIAIDALVPYFRPAGRVRPF